MFKDCRWDITNSAAGRCPSLPTTVSSVAHTAVVMNCCCGRCPSPPTTCLILLCHQLQILRAVKSAVTALGMQSRLAVQRVSITGQMHGVVLWPSPQLPFTASSTAAAGHIDHFLSSERRHPRLVTWRDQVSVTITRMYEPHLHDHVPCGTSLCSAGKLTDGGRLLVGSEEGYPRALRTLLPPEHRDVPLRVTALETQRHLSVTCE